MTFALGLDGAGPRRRFAGGRFRLGTAAGVFGVFLAMSFFSPSQMTVVAAGASLAVILALHWRPSDPSLLLVAAVLQWLSVAVKPILTVFRTLPLNALSEFDSNLEVAAYLGFACVTMLAIGMYFGARVKGEGRNPALFAEISAIPLGTVLRVALTLVVIGQLLQVASAFVGPLRSVVGALATISFGGLFLLAYWCVANDRGYLYLAAVMIYEIVVGFSGYFAEFRTPLIIMGLAAICIPRTVRPKDYAAFVVVLLLGVLLASFWSQVKNDYRGVANQGSGQQEVTASLGARQGYLIDQATSFNQSSLLEGFDKLLFRLSYIDFLASTIAYVPSYLPHEAGAHTGSALLYAMEPRALFPNKPPTPPDSDVTAYYTGLQVNNYGGTSISIGYVGELYIDFGFIGAAISAGVLGLAIGLLYRSIVVFGGLPGSLNLAAAAAFVVSIPTFETALIKFVGGTLLAYLGVLVIQRYALPALVRALARRPRTAV